MSQLEVTPLTKRKPRRKQAYPLPPPVEIPRMDWSLNEATELLRAGTWYEFSEYLRGKVGWDDEKICQTWADVRKEEVVL